MSNQHKVQIFVQYQSNYSNISVRLDDTQRGFHNQTQPVDKQEDQLCGYQVSFTTSK